MLRGEPIDEISVDGGQAAPVEFVDDHDALEEIKFPYCVTYDIIHLNPATRTSDIDTLRRQLTRIGDWVQVTGDLDGVKVHVHTGDPGRALQFALTLGELDVHRIENMLETRRQKQQAAASEPPKPYGMVSVSLGEGFSSILKDLQVDVIVEGGQTMNPSIEDLQKAIDSVNAETVFVFPNNGNVILAAQQAAKLSPKNVLVVPTKNVAMGIAAAVAFQEDLSAEENARRMDEAAQRVRTGTITYAVRDSEFEDMHINEGDIIGLNNGKVEFKADNVRDVAIQLMQKIVTEDDGLITLYYGAETREEDANALGEELEALFPDCDVEVHSGGQPLYYYLISVE